MAVRSRPLSPHLSVYKFTLTMTMSIVHRITGVALYGGSLLLVLWFAAAALGQDALAIMQVVANFWLGQLVLIGFTWALFHHMLGGIKHFLWDRIMAVDPVGREWVVRANLMGSVLLTALAWGLFYFSRGAA